MGDELMPEWSNFVVGVVDSETCDEPRPERLNFARDVADAEDPQGAHA